MTPSYSSPPTLLLACDLGKSAGKFFYKLPQSEPQALWMDAEVALLSASVASQLSSGGRAQDNAWYRCGDRLTLVGKSAQAHLDYNSFKEDKFLKAPERIAAVLGAIAHSHRLPTQFDAIVWILLPLNELGTRHEIATRLNHICHGFRFQNEREYQVSLQLSFRPEGYGIYVNRKQQLQQTGVAIATRTTWIEMLGHRNGTQLAFETGTLNKAKSSSKFPGFWDCFEKAAHAAGVSPPDYNALFHALETGKTQQFSAAKGRQIDFSAAIEQVQSGYLAALAPHFNDHLIPGLASGRGETILAGGAAYLMRFALQQYFEDCGFEERISFAWEMHESLQQLIEAQLPEAHESSSIPVRMVDCFGLFQVLLGEVSRMQGAA